MYADEYVFLSTKQTSAWLSPERLPLEIKQDWNMIVVFDYILYDIIKIEIIKWRDIVDR